METNDKLNHLENIVDLIRIKEKIWKEGYYEQRFFRY
jgi:hypothetical protein